MYGQGPERTRPFLHFKLIFCSQTSVIGSISCDFMFLCVEMCVYENPVSKHTLLFEIFKKVYGILVITFSEVCDYIYVHLRMRGLL